MIYSQMLLDVADETHWDLFAGGGGASTGYEMATGRSPDGAINHDPAAVAMHRINHPQTRHYLSDVFDVDPREVTRGRKVGSAWFSPDCTFFSKSRGGKPIRHASRKRRALAWIVKRWAAQVRPRVIFLENVEEFADWCPLVAKRDSKTGRVLRNDEAVAEGKARVAAPGERVPVEEQQLVPCPMRKSRTFRQWVRSLEALGYVVEWKELRACDYGAPTIRKRLFLVARCDGKPIVWPEPTHGEPESAEVKRGELLPYRTAAECIDWSIPMCSIFATRDEAKAWAKAHGQHAPKRPLAGATMRRLARGVMRFVLRNPKPYIVGVGGRAGQSPERPLDLPYQTITAKGDAALVAPYLVPRYGERDGQQPRVRDIQEPSPVVVPTGNGAMLAAAHLESYHAEKREGEERGAELSDPIATLDTSNRHAVVAAWLAKNFTGVVGSDLGAPKGTITTVDHDSLVTANLVKLRGTSSDADASTPLHTISAQGQHHAIAVAHLTKFQQNSTGAEPDELLHTVMAGATRHGIVAAHLSHAYTSNTNGGQGDPAQPLKTITTGQHAAVVFAWLAKYYGEGIGQEADAPASTLTTKDRLSVVTVALRGIPYVLLDVFMRMLQPRELYSCQGFPLSYVIDRGIFMVRGKPVVKKLTKGAQVRMVGNSVSPLPAAALIRSNVPEMIVRDEALPKPARHGRRARRKAVAYA